MSMSPITFMKNFSFLFQFLPLTVFVATAKANGMTSEGWSTAFQVAAWVATVQSLIGLGLRTPVNRLLAGANLFLFVGGLSFFLAINPVLNFYAEMRESALFASVLLVGLISTFFSPNGFIEVPGMSARKTRRSSVLLLLATCFCLTMSVLFRGNVWLAGTIPFLILIASRRFLQSREQADFDGLAEPEDHAAVRPAGSKNVSR